MSRKDALLVVAIDFGTTYSGFAIQFRHEFDPKDPTKIRAPQPWNGGRQNLMSYKTPTCLLLNEQKEIDCFGFDAEEKYADLCMTKKNREFYYFRRFKMRLQEGEGLKKDSNIEDETGKAMPALKVFALSIECLKMKLMEMLQNEGTGVTDSDVVWVLTVPAIWDDAAKEFMKAAATDAGIDPKYLTIALEPEAASLFCQYLPVEKFADAKQNVFSKARPGTVYMVADLGGGTADITVHEKLADNKIKEVYKATGGPWGGTAVDNAFFQFLVSIVTAPVMSKLQREQTYDYLDLLKEFECAKRGLGAKLVSDRITMKYPATLNELCQKHHDLTFAQLVAESTHKDNVNIVSDKMRVHVNAFEAMFKDVTDKIVKHVRDILKNTDVGKKIALVLCVGGFGESPFVQKELRAGLPSNVKLLVPQQAGLAVLNGAVIYGRIPESITTRILRYTYGVKVSCSFKEGVDQETKRDPRNKEKCTDRFSVFIKEGTSVDRGDKVMEAYRTSVPHQSEMSVHVYTVKGDIPRYVTDSACHRLGTLTVKVPNPSEKIRDLLVIFRFGSTSLSMLAIEKESKKACLTAFGLTE